MGVAKLTTALHDNKLAVKICCYVVPNSHEGRVIGEKILAILFADVAALISV